MHRASLRRRAWVLVLALYALLFGAFAHGQQEAARPIVYVAPLRGEIDNGLAPYVQRAVRQAEQAGAAALVLPIDTLGGRVDAALVIRDALLDARIPTVAFVDPRAISAGALIALAAEDIAMAPGATIGAAAPVVAGPEGRAEPAGEKATSFVRKEFRATAEARGRPTAIFEAMVDADVEIPGVVAKGKLLTLTTEEALALGAASYRAETLDDILAKRGLSGAEIRTLAPNWAEKLVRFSTSPLVSSLLLGFGLMGLFVEIRTPGFGAPGIAGLVCLALFFWSHAILALVGWEELALVGGGIALLLLEIFVIPGFGLAGVLGAAAVLAGLGMSFVGPGVTPAGAVHAAAGVSLALVVTLVGAALLLRLLPRLPFGRRLVLESGPREHALPFAASPLDAILPGDLGKAASPLRPSGIAEITGARVDALSEGEYIPAGAPLEVLRVERSYVVVRRAAEKENG
ncbi:NfeD family protein [Polyangium sp. 6x1]|uniref:NfeD family protein n=1 Tax=Polyangium sp. 6x1 TaxID=3042689 RepID=UPI002482321A|nr:NfeD family protein [Polyangium sp. 6x1]MDI1445173.1 NfeD family protein [Polyangium sp. 6x1]